MTIADDVTHTTWSRVQSGLHVGNRDGEFLGFVEKGPDGRFVAFDGHAEPVGTFTRLEEAEGAVEHG
ncbi:MULTISPECIES: hypothetical protein [Microbacterium]|uniref:Uncharacterized protein n=1 Tax=Microbacterium gilvum TaxID=1336204 RepID=A0ABP9ALK7_9MICO